MSTIQEASPVLTHEPGLDGIVPSELAAPSPVRTMWQLAAVILVAHMAVDIYATIVPSILGVLEARCHMEPKQTAWLLGLGSLCSGLAQPICAWFSDRYRWYGFGALGLLTAAVLICLVGLADRFAVLLPLYLVGMTGVGIFHPIAAASIGALSERRRSSNMSLFFVAGTLGGVSGAALTPRIITSSVGFSALYWAIAPGVLLAWLLHRTIDRVPHPHRAHASRTIHKTDIRSRWIVIAFLYVAAVLRFIVNLALMYLYVRWVQGTVTAGHPDWSKVEVARFSVPMVGNLNACTILGMAIGGLGAGFIVRQGRERWPLVLCPLLFSPAVMLFPHVPLQWGYLLSVFVGIGFAGMIPVSIALAQQLLPHRASFVSGLMMGGAWAVATLGPRLAEYGVEHLGIPVTFYLTGAALAAGGLVLMPLHWFSREVF